MNNTLEQSPESQEPPAQEIESTPKDHENESGNETGKEKPEKPEEYKLTWQEHIYNFLNRREALEQRARVERLAEELFDRVDLEKLATDPDLMYTAGQYKELLSIRQGVSEGLHNKQGYIENTAIGNNLESIKRYWEKHGFLKDEFDTSVNDSVAETITTPELLENKRKALRTSITSSYEKRDFYFTYLRTDSFQIDFTPAVTTLRKVLDIESSDQSLYPHLFGYPKVEYDNSFLEAVKRRAQFLFDGHREAVRENVEKDFEGALIFGKPMGDEEFEFITEKIAPRAKITA
jgi:hypothetical protein